MVREEQVVVESPATENSALAPPLLKVEDLAPPFLKVEEFLSLYVYVTIWFKSSK